MTTRPRFVLAILLSALVATVTAEAQKKTLVIGLNQDPDILDPTLSRTYVGRIIYAHMCEKLYELDETLKIAPQLAEDLPAFADGGKTVTIKLRSGVKFNDGTPLNAEAMKFSLDRHREMKGSSRRSELDHVNAVEVVDPLTVRLRLNANYIVAFPKNLKGYKAVPDGLIRVKGASWN
jgi:peptide/nickel transport system substrate-binding protein